MAVASTPEEMIHLYADGELPFAQHSDLFAYLAVDEEARCLLESIMQFRRLSRLEAFPISPAMDAAFMQRLSRQRLRPSRAVRPPVRQPLWQHRARISLRSAALLAVGLLLLGFFSARPPAPASPPPAAVYRMESSPVLMSAQYVFSPGVEVVAER